MDWDNIPEDTRRYRRVENDGLVKMSSHYFLMSKAGPVSHLLRTILEGKLEGNSCIVQGYNMHGLAASHVDQITCAQDPEQCFYV